jgi:hypothetical protein
MCSIRISTGTPAIVTEGLVVPFSATIVLNFQNYAGPLERVTVIT